MNNLFKTFKALRKALIIWLFEHSQRIYTSLFKTHFNLREMKLQFNKKYLVIAHTLFLLEIAIVFFIKTGFIRHTFGDYLVVILLYAIIRGCTNLKVWVSVLVVLVIAYVVEFLQLTPFLTYFNLQDSFTAKLILGSTFQITDLIAYTMGILTVLIIEHYGYSKNNHTIKI